ncbi:hypothetical protein KKG19_05340, partial [Patescibacteria group bacterium]|nr:hypothetical protein [Patescibacteria group bacterium]
MGRHTFGTALNVGKFDTFRPEGLRGDETWRNKKDKDNNYESNHYFLLCWFLIAALTREHGGWEQARLRTSDERSRVKCLVPAQGTGARHLTKSAPR